VDYVNSSIDTTPDRTRATLEGLDRRVTLLVGGRGKGLSFDPMKDTLIKYANRIVAYGEISKEICEWLDTDPALSKIPHVRFEVFTDVLEYADSCVTKGDTLLLSPAATAYGEFTSFAERGRIFKEYLRNKHT
jgi:UDP-N-acetylmuramoylalanine--D-glutamate ligase